MCEKVPLNDEAWQSALLSEIESLRARLSSTALLRKAKSLRPGLDCWVVSDAESESLMLGGMHLHVEVRFQDGVSWLARLPRIMYTSFANDLTNRLLLNECATLKWLQGIGFPAPRLHAFGLANDALNDVGVAYLLMDKLAGQPLMSRSPSPSQKQKVYAGLAGLFKTLKENPLPEIGCLTLSQDGKNQVQLGPVVGDRTGTLVQLGPFQTAEAYHVAWCEYYLDRIASRQLFAHYSTDAYIMFSMFKDQAAQGVWARQCPQHEKGSFYLKHMDDKGDHILVDDDYNIVGLIDWSFARSVPFYEAFGPSLLTADLASLFGGVAGLSDDDQLMALELAKIDVSLGQVAQRPDSMRRLSLGLGVGMGFTRTESIASFRSAMSTLGLSEPDLDWDQWRKHYLAAHVDDMRLKDLMRQEKSGLEA